MFGGRATGVTNVRPIGSISVEDGVSDGAAPGMAFVLVLVCAVEFPRRHKLSRYGTTCAIDIGA
jgi:hypothetical protein